jgi:hypothetical protein
VDLRRGDLHNIKWRQIKSIKHANIWGISNAPTGFREWALEHGAVEIQFYNDWETYKKEHH